MRIRSRPPLCEEDYVVVDRGFTTPCWIRKGFLTSTGYTKVRIGGTQKYAHRVMYEQTVGPIPDGLVLDHLCRQTDCICPDHVEAVTDAVNIRRGKKIKLSDALVVEIRNEDESIMSKDLAAKYGISESHMSRIRRGVKWKFDVV